MISCYINCISYGASVTVRFELRLPNLVADTYHIEAGTKPRDIVSGATSFTIAFLPGHCICGIFINACSPALTHGIVGVVLEHIHVEVATSEV